MPTYVMSDIQEEEFEFLQQKAAEWYQPLWSVCRPEDPPGQRSGPPYPSLNQMKGYMRNGVHLFKANDPDNGELVGWFAVNDDGQPVWVSNASLVPGAKQEADEQNKFSQEILELLIQFFMEVGRRTGKMDGAPPSGDIDKSVRGAGVILRLEAAKRLKENEDLEVEVVG